MPTYSEVTITFTNDWTLGDKLKLKTWDNNTQTTNWLSEWEWVVTRSSGFEVTTGAVTGTAGERAAIQYELAYDLDYATGYITTQTTNSITIQSETQGEDFVGFSTPTGNTGTATVSYNNYVETPTASNIDFAFVYSPYYISTPFFFDTTTKITIDLYIWEGDLTSEPASPTYTLTKIRPTVDYSEFNTDISEILQTQIDEAPVYDVALTTQIIDNNELKWVKYVASYTDSVETITDVVGYLAACEGYGYYSQGVNPSAPTNEVLTSSANRKIDRSGFILFPYINDGAITSIDIDSDGGQINATETVTSSNESSDYVQYISVDVSQATTDSTITITTLPANDTFVYEIVDECRYSPTYVVFKNKFGFYDTIHFFKKQNTSINVTDDMFVNNYISSGTYDTTKHQFQKLNVQGKKTLRLNSGYIDEDENVLYEELLLSDKVFIHDGSTYVPVNVTSKSLEFRTRINDKLVNYTIDFEYAYNTIQNV